MFAGLEIPRNEAIAKGQHQRQIICRIHHFRVDIFQQSLLHL